MPSLLLLLGFQIAPAVAETPNRQPQLATRGNNVGVAYGAGNAIYFAASTDAGRTFGTSQAEIVAQDGAFPSMAALSNGLVAVAWESKGAIVIQTVE
jgi:hypothetical protein